MTPPPMTPRPRVAYPVRAAVGLYLIAELVVLYLVAVWIGPGWTILAVLASSVLGGALLRVMGTRAVVEYQAAQAEGRPTAPSAIDGVIGVLGAFLLFAPGFIATAVGLLCVFPPTRFLFRMLVRRFLGNRLDSPTMARLFGPRVVRPQRPGPRDTAPDDVVEGEVVDDPGHGRPRGAGPRRDEDRPRRRDVIEPPDENALERS